MVCLGNICRSPLAEGILRKKEIDNDIKLIVDSAGTSNFHIGEKPDNRTIKNALKHGIDISNLTSRQFTELDFDRFDIIYVMDENNLHDVIRMACNKQELKKVNLILDHLYPNANISVPDPYFSVDSAFEDVFQLLNEACEEIISTMKVSD